MPKLQDMLEAGEGQQLDFKKTIGEAAKIAKSMVAFANSEGGKLLIGVRDDRTITGIRSDEEIFMLETASLIHCTPPIVFFTKLHHYQGKTVVEAYVPESKEKPHKAKDEAGKWKVFIRVKDEVKLASPEAIDLMKKKRVGKEQLFTCSPPEMELLRSLETEGLVSVISHSRKTGIPRWKVSKMLINLCLAGLAKLHHGPDGDYFTPLETLQ